MRCMILSLKRYIGIPLFILLLFASVVNEPADRYTPLITKYEGKNELNIRGLLSTLYIMNRAMDLARFPPA